MAPQYFQNRRISGNFNASSENFRTLAAGENKGFEFYRKIIELGPLLYSYHDAPVIRKLPMRYSNIFYIVILLLAISRKLTTTYL